MTSRRGRFVATIFVIRFFPQKLFGKLIGKFVGKLDGKLDGKFVWKIGWKIGWKIWIENWLEMLGGNVGWKIWLEIWLEKMLENLAGNVWLEMLVEHLAGKNVGKNVGWTFWLEKMLVNGCEIIGEKIVATNLPLRLSTTISYWPNGCYLFWKTWNLNLSLQESFSHFEGSKPAPHQSAKRS